MISKFILAFIAFVLGSSFVSAAETFILFRPFVQMFGEGGIYSILSNSKVVFAVIYIAYFMGFFNVLKIALKGVFGDHQKEATTVSMMISFVGVTGMFYMFADDSIDSAILLFGGSIGFFLLLLVCLSFLHFVKKKVNLSKGGWTYLFLSLTFILVALQMYVDKMISAGLTSEFWQTISDGLLTFSSWMFILTIVLAIKAYIQHRKENVSESSDTNDKEDNVELMKSKDAISRIQDNLKDIDKRIKKIKVGLE